MHYLPSERIVLVSFQKSRHLSWNIRLVLYNILKCMKERIGCQGVPMTITYVKSKDERRRSRKRCFYYDSENSVCCCQKSGYHGMDCGYISHCEYYSEGKKGKSPYVIPSYLKANAPKTGC